ncbi:hypothetical protein TK1394 [Thermococcus kodakarensis KOD1]|uniref:Uncharacterized protein n=3 Tax=Thermococcus TaxID=2263 RepID=Q5JGZ6_THEKO|nr:hypothetical protein TK1394 [Thermococcus kodakarensis KOD1]
MGKYTIQSRYQKFRRIIKKHWGEILIFSENSWRYAFSHVRNHPRPSEPTYVGAYLRYGLEYLNNVLPNSKPGNKLDKEGFQLKFGGIFVHQSPIVELDPNHPRVRGLSKKRCEIGDLLVIFTFVDQNNLPLINRAFLSQAKIGNNPVEDAQYVLYEENVRFRFSRPDECNIKNNSCSITTQNCGHRTQGNQNPQTYSRRFPWRRPRSRGLKYLRIYPECETTRLEFLDSDKSYYCPPWICYFPWCCCHNYPFGCSIYGMMIGYDGWAFSTNLSLSSSRQCGWNHIIHDLLSDTAHRVSTLGGLKKKNKLQRGMYLSYLVSQFNRFDNTDEYFIGLNPFDNPSGPEFPKDPEHPEGSVGINTLLIMVKDTEMENEAEEY